MSIEVMSVAYTLTCDSCGDKRESTGWEGHPDYISESDVAESVEFHNCGDCNAVYCPDCRSSNICNECGENCTECNDICDECDRCDYCGHAESCSLNDGDEDDEDDEDEDDEDEDDEDENPCKECTHTECPVHSDHNKVSERAPTGFIWG